MFINDKNKNNNRRVLSSTIDWYFCHPKIRALKVNLQFDDIWSGDFGSWLGHEVGDLINTIGVLKKENMETFLTPSLWGRGEKMVLYEGRSAAHQTESSGTLIWDSQASRTVRLKCLCFKSPNLWHFIVAAQMD